MLINDGNIAQINEVNGWKCKHKQREEEQIVHCKEENTKGYSL